MTTKTGRAPVPTGADLMLDEFHDAVVKAGQPAHDGRWGKARVELTLAVLQSSRERREIHLAHQVPLRH